MILGEASSEYVYAVECQARPGGMWHRVTHWSPESPLNRGAELAPNERIVRRRLGKPQVVVPEYRLERYRDGRWGNATRWYRSLEALSENERISMRPGQTFRIVRRMGDLVDVFKEEVA